MREGSNFVFESVDLLYYSLHKISLNRGGSYIDSPDWIKHKKATINPKSKDNKCLRDSIIAALNHKKIKYNPEKISNLMPFKRKSLNKTIIQLLLMICMYHTILSK